MALFPEKKDTIINEDMILKLPNKLTLLRPDAESWSESVRVVDTRDIEANSSVFLYVNAIKQKGILFKSKKNT